MPQQISLCWPRGDTTIMDGSAFVIVSGGPVPFPLDPTNQVLRFTAKQNYTDSDAQALLAVSSTDGSITVTDGANGRFTITIEPDDYQGVAASPISAPLQLKYDLQVAGANSQNVHTLVSGPLTLLPDVTLSVP